MRRVLVGLVALALVATVIAAPWLLATHLPGKRPPPQGRRATVGQPAIERRPARPGSAPGGAGQFAGARAAASRFVEAFILSAYGGSVRWSAEPVTPPLRAWLASSRGQLAAVQRHRDPRVVSIELEATAPTFVVATARVRDGGMSAYMIRFAVSRIAGRWAVASVREG